MQDSLIAVFSLVLLFACVGWYTSKVCRTAVQMMMDDGFSSACDRLPNRTLRMD